jgi:hypothetical protein
MAGSRGNTNGGNDCRVASRTTARVANPVDSKVVEVDIRGGPVDTQARQGDQVAQGRYRVGQGQSPAGPHRQVGLVGRLHRDVRDDSRHQDPVDLRHPIQVGHLRLATVLVVFHPQASNPVEFQCPVSIQDACPCPA